MNEGIELSEELIRQLGYSNLEEVNNLPPSCYAKFDDLGTLHIIGYDEEGKKVNDIDLSDAKLTKIIDATKNMNQIGEIEDDMALLHEKVSKAKFVNKIIFIVMCAFVILTYFIISRF